jgi:hypothetical protein|tara:strand:- start:1937 stop:2134 length:198 start_codon:yes stop_codon:yes gene_type:complete
MKLLTVFLLGMLMFSCSTDSMHKKRTGLYPWLLNGKSKTQKYAPVKEAWVPRKCRGCKYDPAIWL